MEEDCNRETRYGALGARQMREEADEMAAGTECPRTDLAGERSCKGEDTIPTKTTARCKTIISGVETGRGVLLLLSLWECQQLGCAWHSKILRQVLLLFTWPCIVYNVLLALVPVGETCPRLLNHFPYVMRGPAGENGGGLIGESWGNEGTLAEERRGSPLESHLHGAIGFSNVLPEPSATIRGERQYE